MKIHHRLFIAILLLSFSTKSFGWGPDGHKDIGEVAYSYLDPQTKDSLQFYLGTVTLAKAGLWMDEMRVNREYDYMKPWHYITFEKGETYRPHAGENIMNELNKRVERLKHRDLYNKEQVAVDIKILVHLVEDLHMPLHVGYAADTEGNAIHITFMNKPTTLHWAWDNDIMLQQKINADTLIALLGTFSVRKIALKRKTDILLWMDESRLLLPNVYDFKGDSIGVDYADRNGPIIKLRLALAGLRLAHLLNELFENLPVLPGVEK